MRPETEARIRTVQKFGKNARQFCALAATLFGITLVASWAQIAAGPRLPDTNVRLGTNIIVNSDQLVSVSSKIWAFVVATVVLGIFLGILFRLYRLFKQLEAGAIYTKQNVRHLRNVGWLSMASAVIPTVLSLLSVWFAQLGFIDGTPVTFDPSADGTMILVGGSLAGVVNASLILLASWIMDVGTVVSEDADAMRREAELVI
jgi:Protein of unknown function (DUF2975)